MTALRTRITAKGVAPVAFLLVAAAVPLVAGNPYDLLRYELVLIYMAVALGLNFSFGVAGQLALGQPVVMGAAAYTAGILSAQYNWEAWKTLPAALVIGALMGMLISSPSFRLRGWYLAITTFFAATVFSDLIASAQRWTNGSDGLGGVGALPVVGLPDSSPTWQYEAILVMVAVVWVALRNLSTGTWGIVLRGVRDSPHATSSCGVNVPSVQAWVALISSLPVALAGWIWAHSTQFVAPDSFGLGLLILLIASVMLGGKGTLWGPVIGTIVFQAFSLWVGPFSRFNQLVLGGALLAVSILAPEGIIPLAAHTLRTHAHRLLRRPPPEPQRAITLRPPAARPAADATADLAAAPLVSARSVDKSFGGMRVLRSVDVEVHAGRVVGLVGPNGSGKTTLLNVLTGFVPPDGGHVHVAGEQVTGRSTYRIARGGIRRTFQVPQLIDELSVLENVELALLGGRQWIAGSLLRTPGYRRHRDAVRARAHTACTELGFDDAAMATPAGVLPLGLKRIVEVARAMAADGRVICLDEPAAGLSGSDLELIGDTLRRLAARGYAVLLIEHNLAFVQQYCDSIVLLEGGQVTVSTASATLSENGTRDERMAAFFGSLYVAGQRTMAER